MTDAINWHKDGTPGPWKKVETSDYAEIHNEVIATPVALVGISTTDARAIAEVPAMVAMLRMLIAECGVFHDADNDAIRAILFRIDGGAA